MDDADYNLLPMPREEFERLPMDVQARTLEKARQQHAFLNGNIEARKKRLPHGIAFGAALALILSPLVAISLPFAVLVTVGGAILGAVFVLNQINHLAGVALFGALAIITSIVAYMLGCFNTIQVLFMFFGWIFYCAAGGLLSMWACRTPQSTTRPPPV